MAPFPQHSCLWLLPKSPCDTTKMEAGVAQVELMWSPAPNEGGPPHSPGSSALAKALTGACASLGSPAAPRKSTRAQKLTWEVQINILLKLRCLGAGLEMGEGSKA